MKYLGFGLSVLLLGGCDSTAEKPMSEGSEMGMATFLWMQDLERYDKRQDYVRRQEGQKPVPGRDKVWSLISSTQQQSKTEPLFVQMRPRWAELPYQQRLQVAREMQKLWANRAFPDEPEKAFIILRAESGTPVYGGGSERHVYGGSQDVGNEIWVEPETKPTPKPTKAPAKPIGKPALKPQSKPAGDL